MQDNEEEISTKNKVLTLIGIILYIIAIIFSKNDFAKYLFFVSYIFIGYDII